MKKILFIILLFPSIALATPVITSSPTWSGSLSDGTSVTISGGGFGSKPTAAPWKYEDVDSATTGASATTLSGVDTYEGSCTISTALKHGSTGKSVLCDISANKASVPGFAATQAALFGWRNVSAFTTGKAIIDVWYHLEYPPADKQNISVQTGWQEKIMAFYSNQSSTGAYTTPLAGVSLVAWTYKKADGIWDTSDDEYHRYYRVYAADGGDPPVYHSGPYPYLSKVMYPSFSLMNKWHHMTLLTSQGRGDGTVRVYHTAVSSTGAIENKSVSTVYTTAVNGDFLDSIKFGYYIDPDGVVAQKINYWDSIYIDNTWQRVELGDKPNYNDCTHREIQVPETWSTSSIRFTAKRGTFGASDTVYVFVSDNSNIQNSVGKAITFAESTPPEDVVVSVYATDSTATEASTTTGQFTIYCDACTGTDQVSWSLSGTAQGSGIDYNVTGSSPVTAGNFPYTVTITPVDDSDVEANETVVITLSSPSGTSPPVLSTSTATITIVSDDIPDVTPPDPETCDAVDPITIVEDNLDIAFTADDTATECKWRIGAAPDDTHGVLTDALTYALDISGFSNGSNILFIGCKDFSDEWGSNNITVTFNNPYIKRTNIISSGTSPIRSGGRGPITD